LPKFDLHPDLLMGFPQRRGGRTLAKIHVSAWEGPAADLRLDATAQQKDAARIDYEASGNQLGARKKDKTAAAAHLELPVIRQDGSHSHLTAAQGAEARVFRKLMLNTMVSVHGEIVVSHRYYRAAVLKG
jgi:hypothetical protein